MRLINNFNISLRKVSGIYIIKNITTLDLYVGSANCLYSRFIRHKTQLEKNKHHSRYLQRAYNKYGKDEFVMIPILLCDCKYLLKYEQDLIDELDPKYNMRKIAKSNKGYKWSESSKQKLSNTVKGRSGYWLGKSRSEETKLKIKQSRSGKYCGVSNPSYGIKRSEEFKEKLRKANLGKKWSTEVKTKIGKSHCIPIIIKGVRYESSKQAAKILNVSASTLSRWLKNPNKKEYNYEIDRK